MSKSSSAISRVIFGGAFRASMRNAAPILFWSSAILFVLTVAAFSASSLFPGENDQTDQSTRLYLIFSGMVQGLNNAVWPFTGAAIVSVLQNRAGGDSE